MKKRILPLFLMSLPILSLTACSEELKTTLSDAGMNTLVGMGVVFVILILIMLVTNNEYLKTKFSVLRRKKA